MSALRAALAAGLLLALAVGAGAASEDFFAAGGPLDRPSASVEGAKAGAGDGGDFGTAFLFRVAAGLGATALLGWGLYKIALKLRTGSFGGGSDLFRPLACQPLSPNAYLQVVEIGNKAVVLAVSDKAVVPVTEITDPESLSALRFETERRISGASFPQALASAWGRARRMGEERLSERPNGPAAPAVPAAPAAPAVPAVPADETPAARFARARRRLEGLVLS